MGLTNFPYGISSQGMPVPFLVRGTVWYVDSNNGSDTNHGKNATKALATVDAAIGKATANNDDLIVLLPGHAENLAAATTLQIDKAGLTVIGLGEGEKIPTFSTTVAAGGLNIDSSNTYIKNIRITSNFTNGTTAGIDIATGLSGIVLDGIQTRETSNTKEMLIHLNIAGTLTNSTIKNCSFIGVTGGSTTNAILESGILTNVRFLDNYIYVYASDDVMDFATSVSVGIFVKGNTVYNMDTTVAGYCIRFKSDATGIVENNIFAYNKNDAEVTVGAAVWWFENYCSNTVGESGKLDPANSAAIP